MPAFVGARRALLSRRPAATASVYDPDATAYFARMGTQESDVFKAAVNTFVLGLKADGVWSLLDRIGLFATTLPANALCDMKAGTKGYSFSGTTTFTPGRGIAGDGVSGFVDFGEPVNGPGNQFVQDSASVGVWCNATDNVGSTAVPHFGGVSANRTNLYARSSSTESARINASANDTSVRASVSRLGHRSGSRTGATTARYYFNGAFTTAYTSASMAPNAPYATLLRDGTAYCNDRIAAAWIGGGMSDAQVGYVHARLSTLLTTLGAN